MSVVLTLTAAAKTFLIGEYIALTGAPTLLINTAPLFTLTVTQISPATSNLHPHSPAGRLLQDHHELAETYQFHFHDPYQQQGGLGASSAQFLLMYQALHYLTHQVAIDWHSQTSIEKLLTCYQTHAWSGQGLPPSGADLVAQAVGQLCHFTRQPFVLTHQPWPFTEIELTVVHTRHKLATHHHLIERPEYPHETLITIAHQAISALQQSCASSFANAIQAYGDCLAAHELITEISRAWLKKIQALPGVLACKGCGALGADTLLILTSPAATSAVRQWLHQQPLPIIATTEQITSGLNIHPHLLSNRLYKNN